MNRYLSTDLEMYKNLNVNSFMVVCAKILLAMLRTDNFDKTYKNILTDKIYKNILTDKISKTFPGLLEVRTLPAGYNKNSTNQSLFSEKNYWS